MNVADRARRNILFKSLAELSRLVGAAFVIYVGRWLGDEGFGQFSFAFAFTSIFVMVADLGLNTFLIREVARCRGEGSRLASSILGLKLVLEGIAVLAVLLAILALGYRRETVILVVLFAGVNIFRNLLEYFAALFTGLEVMQYEVLLKAFNQVATAAVGVTVLVLGGDVRTLVGSMLAVNALSVAAGVGLTAAVAGPVRPRWDPTLWARQLREALPIALAVMFSVAYFKVDVVFLSVLGLPDAAVGWYTAASKVIEACGVLPALVMSALFPILADLSVNRRESLRGPHGNVLRISVWLAAGLALFFWLTAGPVIELLFGAAYRPAAGSLRILGLSLVFIFPNYVVLTASLAGGQQVLNAVATGAALGTNVLLDLLLIPRAGAEGAAAALALSQGLLLGVVLSGISREALPRDLVRTFGRPLGVAAAALAAGVVLDTLLGLGLGTVLALGIYLAGAGVLGVLGREERGAVRLALRSRGRTVRGPAVPVKGQHGGRGTAGAIKERLMAYYASSPEYYARLVEEFGGGRNLQVGFVDLVGLAKGAERILDAGCGSGSLALYLKERFPEKEIHGVDVSPLGIRRATDTAEGRGLRVAWHILDVETTVPVARGYFDLIVCHEVLEHLTNPEEAIHNMAEALRGGGKLAMIAPNLLIRAPLGLQVRKGAQLLRMLVDASYLQPTLVSPHFQWVGGDADATYLTNPFELHRMARRAGLRLVRKSLLRCLLVAERVG